MPFARRPLCCHLFQQDGPVDRTGIRYCSCRICPSRSAQALRLAPTRICGLHAHRRCYDAPWIKADDLQDSTAACRSGARLVTVRPQRSHDTRPRFIEGCPARTCRSPGSHLPHVSSATPCTGRVVSILVAFRSHLSYLFATRKSPVARQKTTRYANLCLGAAFGLACSLAGFGCGSTISPENGTLRCGTGSSPCPAGYECYSLNNLCYRNGQLPKDGGGDGVSARVDGYADLNIGTSVDAASGGMTGGTDGARPGGSGGTTPDASMAGG